MVLGIIVIVIVGGLVIRYLKADRGTIPQELLNQPNSIESTLKLTKYKKMKAFGKLQKIIMVTVLNGLI